MEANGLYFGESEQPGQFTWWDGGTWEVHVPGKLALAIANDAIVTYDYGLDGDLLTITDARAAGSGIAASVEARGTQIVGLRPSRGRIAA